jgi:molecular chaperone GrpE
VTRSADVHTFVCIARLERIFTMRLYQKIASSCFGPWFLPSRLPPTHQELQEQLSQVQFALEQALRDAQYYREALEETQGDLGRIRERANHARVEYSRQGKQAVLQQLLPFLNDLQRTFQERPAGLRDHPWATGVELVSNQLTTALSQLGLYAFGRPGEPFDPRWHEAVDVEVRPDLAEGTIVRVLQQGYVLERQVIMPARVSVSIASSSEALPSRQQASS